MEEFFTVQQVAESLKVHPITIRRYIREGKIKAIRAGGNIRVAQHEVNAFVQSFVPRSKNFKDFPKNTQGNFSFNDPLFRLKGRGLGIDIASRKDK
jgi:excisionase family DNA binding protein